MSTRYDDDDYLAGFDKCIRCGDVCAESDINESGVCYWCELSRTLEWEYKDDE
jgi:hypothetical protein